MSDSQEIEFEYEERGQRFTTKQLRFNIKQLDWLKLKAKLSDKIGSLQPHWVKQIDIDEAISRLTSTIQECSKESLLKRYRGKNTRKRMVP